jgi:hypothetical protein
MISVRNAGIADYIMIIKSVRKLRNNEYNYYSDFKDCILGYILKKECFIIFKNDIRTGILFINNSTRDILYVPNEKSSLSFFRFSYILNKYFTLEGYRLSLKYQKINVDNFKKYFHVDIVEDYKHMHLSVKPIINTGTNSDESLNVRILELYKEEPIRVMLQNEIFGELKGRIDLTLGEVYEEERKNSFLKDMCFILSVNESQAGYGQIIFMEDMYYLVNFGIIPEYRSKGYGNYFLSQIIFGLLLSRHPDIYIGILITI